MAAMEPIPDTVLEGTNVGRGHGVQTKWTGDYYKEGNLVSTVCVTVWHINEYRHFALPQQNYGHFHSGMMSSLIFRSFIEKMNFKGCFTVVQNKTAPASLSTFIFSLQYQYERSCFVVSTY